MLTLTIWFCLLFFHNLPINNFSPLPLAFHKVERCMSHPFYLHRCVSYHHLTSLTSYFSKKNNKIIKIFFWRIKKILKAKRISVPLILFLCCQRIYQKTFHQIFVWEVKIGKTYIVNKYPTELKLQFACVIIK